MHKKQARRKVEAKPDLTGTKALEEEAQHLQAMIMRLDFMIEDIDSQLAQLQPPNGRIRIEWYACRTSWAKGARCPQPCRWFLTPSGAWQAERLPLTNLTRRAKKHGWFYETHETVRAALVELSQILELRARLSTTVSRYLLALSNLRTANSTKLDELERQIDLRADWLKVHGRELLWVKELGGENERARQAQERTQRQS